MNGINDDHRKSVGEWLALPYVWRIPVYQRHYAWDAEDQSGPIHLFWETVKEQTESRLKGESPSPHYFGAVLVEYKPDPQARDGITNYDVVDGQQRLTTIQIALLALIKIANTHNCDLKSELAQYVFSNRERNETRLFPTNYDNHQFKAVLFYAYDIIIGIDAQNTTRENAERSKIFSVFDFFKKVYGDVLRDNHQYKEEKIIRAIMKTLIEGFDIVRIVLHPTDEAQKVFESLNNNAKPLTTFDLIRNNVFHRAASVRLGEDQRLFDTDAWQQFEKPYWEKKADNQLNNWSTHIEAYIARMLVAQMRTNFSFKRNEIFRTYKKFCEDRKFPSIEEEIKTLGCYVDVYKYLDKEIEINPVAKETDFGVFRYSIWKKRDFYPVIFSIVGSGVGVDEKQKMINLLESYVIRRAICGLPNTPYNKYAVNICKELGDEPSYRALYKMLEKATADTYVFPDDDRVKDSCVNVGFYKSIFQRYVFEKIEESMSSGETDVVPGLTIDHILPQGWDKNQQWRNIVLGSDGKMDEGTVNAYINTIGNLTIMSRKNNSAKSNRPFEKVKEILADSDIGLNRKLAKEETWNVEKIRARSKCLADKICKIWPYDIK